MTDVSLIIPICQAESFLTGSLRTIDDYLNTVSGRWELVLAIDASSDRSAEICREFAQQRRPYAVTVIANDTRLGKGGNVKRAMLESRGGYRLFTDCDLAYSLSDITRILAALQAGADVAIASRAHPDARYTISRGNLHYLYTRHLFSRLYNMIINRTLLHGWTDTQAGLKGFSGRAAEFIFSQTRLTDFSFDVEVLYLADRARLHVVELPVHFYYPREPSTVDFLRDALRMLQGICRVYAWGTQGAYAFTPPFRPRRIVINADDFGLSRGINAGILAAMERGIVGSASVMVNLPDSMEALQLARERRLDIGWHVNLTLGRPVCDPAAIPSLVRADGTFHSVAQLLLRCLLRRVRADEVARELEAQWHAFEVVGVRPDGLDGHQHCHVFPVICEAVRDFVTAHRIRLVRVPVEQGGLFVPRYVTRAILRYMTGSRPGFWNIDGCLALPCYGISLVGRAENQQAWRRLLTRIADPLSMVMVHPGMAPPGDNLHGDHFPGDRQEELHLLCSTEWTAMLDEMRIELIPLRELVNALGKTPSAPRGLSPLTAERDPVPQAL